MRVGAKAALRLDPGGSFAVVCSEFAPFCSSLGEQSGVSPFLLCRRSFATAVPSSLLFQIPRNAPNFLPLKKPKCKVVIIIIIATAFWGKKSTDRDSPRPEVKKLIPILLLQRG